MSNMSLSARKFQKSHTFVFWVIVLLFIFSLLGILKIWQLNKASVFNTSWRTNILLVSDPMVVVSVPKNQQEKIQFVNVPAHTLVRVPWGYGYYK